MSQNNGVSTHMQPIAIDQWEYANEALPADGFTQQQHFALLNRWGELGWEAYAVVPLGLPVGKFMYAFKRRVRRTG